MDNIQEVNDEIAAIADAMETVAMNITAPKTFLEKMRYQQAQAADEIAAHFNRQVAEDKRNEALAKARAKRAKSKPKETTRRLVSKSQVEVTEVPDELSGDQ